MIAVAASLALAVVLLDATSVAVLLPSIRVELGSSSSGAAWVMAAYLLALAALLPAVARVGGGARGRAFAAAGAALMVAGAVTGATAGSTAALVAGRALQGAGAAALLGSLAGAPLTRAALVPPALALALGPLAGGVFAELNWWHVYFWVGVPLAALAAIPALLAPRPEPAPEAHELPRRLALGAGLTAITIALVQGEDWSWGWSALALLAGAVLVRAARPGGPSRSAAVAAVAFGCLAALAFLMPEYFELVRRLSGLRTGIVLLALTVPAVAGWALARASRAWLPELPVALAGAVDAAVGLAVLITLEPRTAYAVSLGALVLAGGGLGVAAGAVRDGRAPAHAAGWAAAGAALGLAAAAASFQAAQADERSGGASFEQALAGGIGWAAVFLLVSMVAVGLLMWVRPASSAARPAAASSPPPRRPA